MGDGEDVVRNAARDVDNLVQAQTIYGDVHFNERSAPAADDENPFVVSTMSYSPGVTLLVDADPPTSKILLSGPGRVSVTVEGLRGQAVILRGLRPVVLTRRSPRPAVYSENFGAGLTPREFDVDLDQRGPELTARLVPFPFTVSAGDPEEFLLRPRVSEYEVSWQLELDWTYMGHHGRTIINDKGEPFKLYPHNCPTCVLLDYPSDLWERWSATPEAREERDAAWRRSSTPPMLSANPIIIGETSLDDYWID